MIVTPASPGAKNANYQNAMVRNNLASLLRQIQQELYKQTVIKMVPGLERLGEQFMKDVVDFANANSGRYGGFRAAFSLAVKKLTRPKVSINVNPGSRGRNLIVLNLIQWSRAELDKHTRQQIKRSFYNGQKRVFPTKFNSSYGWWYYFENGAAARNWGSDKYIFVPGPRGGGRMMTLESLKAHNLSPDTQSTRIINKTNRFFAENPKADINSPAFAKTKKTFDRAVLTQRLMESAQGRRPHPGVMKVGMFAAAFKKQAQELELKVRKLFKEASASLTDSDIDLAIERVLSNNGLSSKNQLDTYVQILRANKAPYPRTYAPDPNKAPKGSKAEQNKLANYAYLQELYKRIGAV